MLRNKSSLDMPSRQNLKKTSSFQSAETTTCVVSSLLLFVYFTMKLLRIIEDLYALLCFWDVKSLEYKNRDKRRDTMESLTKKYNIANHDMECGSDGFILTT